MLWRVFEKKIRIADGRCWIVVVIPYVTIQWVARYIYIITYEHTCTRGLTLSSGQVFFSTRVCLEPQADHTQESSTESSTPTNNSYYKTFGTRNQGDMRLCREKKGKGGRRRRKGKREEAKKQHLRCGFAGLFCQHTTPTTTTLQTSYRMYH